MTNSKQTQPFPIIALMAVSAATLCCVRVISQRPADYLAPYFGTVPPLLSALLACAAGIAALDYLHRKCGIFVYSASAFRRGAAAAFVLALPFMLSVTLADIVIGFPQNINVPLPVAILFYPAMGFIAQMALHIVPLALLLAAGRILLRSGATTLRLWISFLLVATLESAFQYTASSAGDGLSPLAAFVAAQLFFFGLAEFYLLRRFDFASMFTFRMIYYGYWHLAWGNFRLGWLF